MPVALSAGFGEPGVEAQRTFRLLLDAMSHPGRIATVDGALTAPRPLGHAAAAVCLTLVDYETPLWIDAAALPATDWLRFHCGCPVTADPAAAGFALVPGGGRMPALQSFGLGEDEYPDRSTTVILEVEALGAGSPVRLSGPGIQTVAELRVAGLPDGFWAEWQAHGALFPRGVDVILTAGRRLAGLPRTVRVEA